MIAEHVLAECISGNGREELIWQGVSGKRPTKRRRTDVKILMVLTSYDRLATLAAKRASGLRNSRPHILFSGLLAWS
jgi:hypothetical protein